MNSNDYLDDNIIKISENEYIDIDFLKKVYNISFGDLKNNIDLILINIKEKNTGLLDSNFNLYSHKIEEDYKKIFNEYIVKKYYENISMIDSKITKCHYDFRRIESIKELRFFINKRGKKTLNFNLNDFYKNNNLFDIEFYKEKYYNKYYYKNLTDKEIIINYLKNGTLLNHVYSRKLIFIFYIPILDFKIGGHVAMYNSFKQIKNLNNPNFTSKLFNIQQIRFKSKFCDYEDFIDLENINNNCIVIYPEIVKGNPLGLKHVIRWILLAIGIETKQDTVDTWGKNDLIINWESEDESSNLRLHYLKEEFQIKDKKIKRKGDCYLVKKGILTHDEKDIKNHGTLIDDLNDKSISNIFCKSEVFYTYDHKTMFISYAILCGCTVVIIPFKGLNKEEFFKQSIYNHNKTILNEGIAFGKDELNFAKNTVNKGIENINFIFKSEKKKFLIKIESIYKHFSNIINENKS